MCVSASKLSQLQETVTTAQVVQLPGTQLHPQGVAAVGPATTGNMDQMTVEVAEGDWRAERPLWKASLAAGGALEESSLSPDPSPNLRSEPEIFHRPSTGSLPK